MRVLADFLLESDLCLAHDSVPLSWKNQVDNLVVEISNCDSKSSDESAVLAARLIFDAESLEVAIDSAKDKIVEVLNCLSYATNRRFAYLSFLKVIDWSPGLKERDAILFHMSPFDDRCEPALTADIAQTVAQLMNANRSQELSTALRWYRLGIGSPDLNDQFAYFWRSLEIAAQKIKTPEKIPSKCPHCHGALYCPQCKDTPLHRPYPGDAIRQLIYRIDPANVDEVFDTLQKIRHTLMHGKTIDSIAHDLPCTSGQAIEKLARVTWTALAFIFDKSTLDNDTQLTFGVPDQVVRGSLVARFHVNVGMKNGDPTNPHIEDFPSVEIGVDYLSREG